MKPTAHLPFLRRAKKYGTYCVFETAVEQRIGILELAELVKGLRLIQSTSRHNWNCGVPYHYSKRGQFGPASPLWQSPEGILGEHKELMVQAMLLLNCPTGYIVDRLGVTEGYVEKVRADWLESDDYDEIKQSRRDFADCCAA